MYHPAKRPPEDVTLPSSASDSWNCCPLLGPSPSVRPLVTVITVSAVPEESVPWMSTSAAVSASTLSFVLSAMLLAMVNVPLPLSLLSALIVSCWPATVLVRLSLMSIPAAAVRVNTVDPDLSNPPFVASESSHQQMSMCVLLLRH